MAIFTVTNQSGKANSFNSWITSIEATLDGDLMVYGNFTEYQDQTANNIVKIDIVDGSVKINFDFGVGFTGGYAFSQTGTFMDSAGNFYVGGQFSTYKGDPAKNIVKILANGNIDTSFVYGSGLSNDYSLKPLVNGSGDIFYVGKGTLYNGTTIGRIMKVSSLGIVDAAYNANVGSGFNNVTIQALDAGAGAIYVHGYFSDFNGSTANKIVKLNADGTLNTAFQTNVGTGFNNASPDDYMDGVIDSNGDILMVGLFNLYNGASVGQVARLNADGTLDTGFVQGAGFTGGRPFSVAIDGNKYLISGTFTHYDGAPVQSTVLLNNDGSLDENFNLIVESGYGYEEAVRIGSYWYAAANNYNTSNYRIVRIADDGSKKFI